jgi:hypothetical protein
MLLIGILSVILDVVLGTNYDRMEDAFEWTLALLLNIYFAALALCWRCEDARLVVRIGSH